jgi:hypothetical protein
MPLQRDQPRARENPRTALSACQRVIVKNRKSRASKFLQLLLILQSSSSKFMSTLMLTARQRSLPDLLFLVQRKGFGAGFVPGVGAEDNTDGVAVPVPVAEYLVELSGVPGTPKVSMFEARKHLAREPSERIGELSGVVSVREGVL